MYYKKKTQKQIFADHKKHLVRTGNHTRNLSTAVVYATTVPLRHSN